MRGRVLDIGGKKKGHRGLFRPPFSKVIKWEYLNSDSKTEPDFCTTADTIPLPNNSIDTIVMTELIEYLPNPYKVLHEINRVACMDAHILISTPLLNPIHGDYWADRARYTPVMLEEMFEETGFKICSIEPMGSLGAVIYDTLRVAFDHAYDSGRNRYYGRILRATIPIFKWIDKKSHKQKKYINTGYFVVLKKSI